MMKEYIKEDKDKCWKNLRASYNDPDKKSVKYFGKSQTKCTADGLFSINRIYNKNGLTEDMVADYRICRKKPIFFFPQERGGINQLRYSVFGDRIDHTLFDLKNYFDYKNNFEYKNYCRLAKAYDKPKTSEWLEDINDFKQLVEWYDIKGIFVNDKYEVIDIEAGDGKIIDTYKKTYKREWSDDYYDHLKKIVDKYYKN